jgi:hypothetical protein
MLVEEEVMWIGDNDFKTRNPAICEIVGFRIGKDSKGRDDRLLTIRVEDKARQMSIYADSLNALIKLLGKDTDKWIGRTIQIMSVKGVDGKNKKLIMPGER